MEKRRNPANYLECECCSVICQSCSVKGPPGAFPVNGSVPIFHDSHLKRPWVLKSLKSPGVWKSLKRPCKILECRDLIFRGISIFFWHGVLVCVPKPWPCRESGRRKLMWKYSRPAVWRKHACSRALHAPLLNAVGFFLFPATSFRLSWNITASHFSSATSLSISPCQDCWRSGWILELKFRTPVCCSLLVCFVCLSLLHIVASTMNHFPYSHQRSTHTYPKNVLSNITNPDLFS